MQSNGISKLDLKRLNRTEILRLICQNGPISRIDLAKKLHLTRAAVTIISGEMMKQGILYERGEQPAATERNTRGRKKVLLDICENYRFSFGVVIDRAKMKIGLTTLKGNTLEHRTLPVDRLTIEQLVEQLYAEIKDMMKQNCLTNASILGIGACLCDSSTQLFHKPSVQDCLPILRHMMEMRFTLPVVVANTTSSLAIAEQYFFPEKEKPRNVLYVRYDYDIDAAVLLNGKLYQEGMRPCNWFSHVVVDTQGEYCVCGKVGCCITKMSIEGIIFKIKEAYQNGQTPLLFRQTGGQLEKLEFTVENLPFLLQEEVVQRLHHEAFQYLMAALDNIITVLNPTRVVLFGFVFEHVLGVEELTRVMDTKNYQTLKNYITLSNISERSIFLAGSGQCVKHFFVDKGAL